MIVENKNYSVKELIGKKCIYVDKIFGDDLDEYSKVPCTITDVVISFDLENKFTMGLFKLTPVDKEGTDPDIVRWLEDTFIDIEDIDF